MESTLKKFFGYSTFRPYQKEIIENILNGKDCLVIMATGSGKSLCYQVPPLIMKKTAVIISPLISLMQDQVMALKQRGIKAEFLSSAQTDSSVHGKAERGQCDILYLTPEKACILPNSFWMTLQKTGISLLAIDEAHCISEWGHNFRVEYKQLDKLRDVLLNVPFVALTATATEKVRKDITQSLKMKDPNITVGSFDRPNLFYGVKSFTRGSSFLDELIKEITEYVENKCSTIVYCTTINDVEQTFKSLEQVGVKAGMYHGSMSNKAREESHRSYIRDEVYVMIATVAFGMGIDKPNIRYVIHYGCPKSLESYYQESGRCGRDGIASVCLLYYTRSDFGKADFYCGEARSADQRKAIMESFVAAQHYCLLTTCRRQYLLGYFGEKCGSDKCGNCDNCTSTREENDMSREAFLLMACIRSCGGHWGLNLPIDVLRGSRSKKILDAQFDKLPFHGLGKDSQANWWKALAYQLISRGYLVETFKDVYKTVSVGPKGLQFLSSCTPDQQPPLYLTMTSEMANDDEKKDTVEALNNVPSMDSKLFSQDEGQLVKMLLDERTKLARASGTAPYAICGDQTLQRIALTRPSTKARLANIDGVNQHLMKMYGDRILQCIQNWSQELNLSLDGEQKSTQSPVPRKLVTTQRSDKLTPAKFEAWKMWQEDGLTIHRIANYPGRAAPIKEQTVIEYLLEAVREGHVLDWVRLCEEIGLTKEFFTAIQNVILKVGTEKLKPIKTELPEEVTYPQIKACLLMQELGLTVFPSNETLESSDYPEKSDVADFEENNVGIEEECDDSLVVHKRRKIDAPDTKMCSGIEATESCVLSFIEGFENGVSLCDVVKHFNGSTEEFVKNLLSDLESEFMIYKKNNVYKLM